MAYRRKQRPSLALQVRPTTSDIRICTVKVENLSKVTSEADLLSRLKKYAASIQSIHLVDCPRSPVNYAYINCKGLSTAQELVKEVHCKMMFHSNLVTAKLKDQVSMVQSDFSKHTEAKKDISSVKILIPERGSLTGETLDRYFSQFGDLTSRTIIRNGNPDFAYINYMDPIAAQAVRNRSPHHIEGTLIQVPSYRATRYSRPTNPMIEFTNMDLTCDPLAVGYVKEEMIQQFKKTSEEVRITTKNDKIGIYAKAMIMDQISTDVQKSISKQQSLIKCVDISLKSYYLPVLADEMIQKKIAEISVPFEIKVFRESTYVPIRDLAQEYSRSSKTFDQDDFLKVYLVLTQKDRTKYQYQWFWEDETKFEPYDGLVNKQLEKAYRSRSTISQVIGRFEYEIDTSKMRQRNKRTNKKRNIERRHITGIVNDDSITLQLRSHSDHLHEIEREIMDVMNRLIREIKFEVPFIHQGTTVMKDLLKIANRTFVGVKKSSDDAEIVLTGLYEIIKDTEIQLKEKLLKLRSEKSEILVPKISAESTMPHSWEPQTRNCELKLVSRGSEEWNNVYKHIVTGVEFQPNIKRIERIQNMWLWKRYDEARRRMSEKNKGHVNERMLFHGTKRTEPKKIYDSEQGFDSRLASEGLWGTGTYFAVKAAYSDRYAYTTADGHKQMFLAEVITGVTCKCPQNRALKAPPKKDDCPSYAVGTSTRSMFEDELYDSVNGETGGSEIFVIYEHGKVYPSYLITYTQNYIF